MSTWKSFLLAFTALLPLINPLGSAIIFLGLVGDEPAAVYRQLARKIAIATFGFLVVIEFLGSVILHLFGISLPIVQVTGGVVIAATAWAILFERDAGANTAGPGTLVVMLTLGAHASQNNLTGKVAGYSGIAIASALLCGAVYVCYAYAPKMTNSVAPSTVHGILRVVAFILMCLGVQIAWNGISLLVPVLPMHN
jgi:multiple antibiotic resistance protein